MRSPRAAGNRTASGSCARHLGRVTASAAASRKTPARTRTLRRCRDDVSFAPARWLPLLPLLGFTGVSQFESTAAVFAFVAVIARQHEAAGIVVVAAARRQHFEG